MASVTMGDGPVLPDFGLPEELRELIEWPVDNSQREDVVYERSVDRWDHTHTQSSHARSPLPANERRQGRWNANPWDITAGGDGRVEMDPGAWLLPYWMARYHGLLSADD